MQRLRCWQEAGTVAKVRESTILFQAPAICDQRKLIQKMGQLASINSLRLAKLESEDRIIDICAGSIPTYCGFLYFFPNAFFHLINYSK